MEIDEKGINAANNEVLIEIDAKYFRPTEVDLLIGDATKANTKLGWVPKCDVEQLAKEMMANDLELLKRDKYLLDGGHKVLNFHE